MKQQERGPTKALYTNVLRGIVIAVGLVLIVSGVIVLIEPRPREESVVTGSSSLASDVYLNVQLKNNILYGNNTTLVNPKTVFPNITRRIYLTVALEYFSTDVNTTNASIYYYVTLNSTSPTWTKVTFEKSWSESISSGKESTLQVGVNVTSNLTEAASIDRQLNITFGSSQSVVILLECLSGSLSAKSTITISNTSYHEYDVTGPNSSAPDVVNATRSELVGNAPFMPLSLVYGYVLIPVGVITAVSPLLSVGRRGKDPASRFRSEHSDVLVELGKGPSESARMVRNPDDILKMAFLTEKPVFIHGNVVFIEVEGKEYYAEIVSA